MNMSQDMNKEEHELYELANGMNIGKDYPAILKTTVEERLK